MADNQFYAAIDLGTTNSVFSYANIVRNKMKPVVLEIERKNDTGSRSRSPLLPSVVFYYKNKEGKMVNDVGDYAKSRYGTRSGYVCKSVKSLMGISDRVDLVEEIEDKTPSDVSGQILSYMLNNAKKRLFQSELNDVVITVPASFDSDQCQATIDAAKKAGINVENMHDILLYEPKAVIYDFMRMQEDGEIPSNLLSLDTDKNIMVFDLGGGTLDVTIHKVGYSEEGIINIKDIAISRYTQIGGDNFDEILAAEMLKRFEKMCEVKVSIKRREEVMCKLRKLAEHLKTDLSQEYENASIAGVELDDEYEFEVMDINLYDSYAYEDYFTKKEIEEIVTPLIGKGYTKKDVAMIQNMGERDVNNIIYPILDVLEKAGAGVNIDAVILNGGMTKFYLIKNRLREFFGFDPLTTSDPDLAVARGAVYYHYCLHKYNVRSIQSKQMEEVDDTTVEEIKQDIKRTNIFNTDTILNDSINIGLRGEYVSLLIPAGTELPFRSEEIRDRFTLDKETSTVGIEMYLGRGKTKNIPNRRIATRTVDFKKSFPAGTPISFQIYINSMRMMTLEAWITGKPKTKTIMEMDMASLKTAVKSSKDIATTEKIKLNAKSEINNLKNLAERNKTKAGHAFNETIANSIKAIGLAANPEDFFEPCMDAAGQCKQNDMMLAYIYSIALEFKDSWTEQQNRQILNMAKRHFDSNFSFIPQHHYVQRKAISLIAELELDFTGFVENYFNISGDTSDIIRSAMIFCVVSKEDSDEKLARFLKDNVKASDMNEHIARILNQRYGYGTTKENQQYFAKFVKILADGLKVKDKNAIPKYLPVLITELCSLDVHNPLRDDTHTVKYVWKALKVYLDNEEDVEFRDILKMIWDGKLLTTEKLQYVRGFMLNPEALHK